MILSSYGNVRSVHFYFLHRLLDFCIYKTLTGSVNTRILFGFLCLDIRTKISVRTYTYRLTAF